MTLKKLAYCLTWLTVAAGFSACSREFDYEYISLTKSMTAVAYGEPDVLGIHDHSRMPISYVLERSDYSVYADFDAKSNRPTMIISVEGKIQKDIGFNVDIFGGVRCFLQFDDISPFAFEHYGYRAGSIRLEWISGRKAPPCDKVSPPSDQDRKITLSIFKSGVGMIAQEELRFDIVRNGGRTLYDSL